MSRYRTFLNESGSEEEDGPGSPEIPFEDGSLRNYESDDQHDTIVSSYTIDY